MLGVVGASASALAQFKDAEPGGPKLGDSEVSKWRCGMVITAAGGACQGVIGYVPVPSDWPEQQVKIVEEDVSPEVTVSYETVEGAAKIMTFKIRTWTPARRPRPW